MKDYELNKAANSFLDEEDCESFYETFKAGARWQKARCSVKTSDEMQDVSKVVDQPDLNTDLLQLQGYLWSLGCTEEVFPTEHMLEIHQAFIDKYGNVKPKTDE